MEAKRWMHEGGGQVKESFVEGKAGYNTTWEATNEEEMRKRGGEKHMTLDTFAYLFISFLY